MANGVGFLPEQQIDSVSDPIRRILVLRLRHRSSGANA